MALMGGLGGGQGPTLYMTISAKDNTKEALDRATANVNVYANNVDIAMERVGGSVDRVTTNFDKLGSVALSTMGRVGSLATSFATLGSVTGLLTNEQSRAIGVFGTAISVMTTVASVVKALTAIEWAHVAALTWKVALMTLGVGVAIAAAAALAVLAMQTQKAADSQKNYNTELEKGNRLQRRGANQRIVSRSGYVEIID